MKGDDATECAAYTLAWFSGRERRRSGRATELIGLGGLPGSPEDAPPSLSTITHELSERSALEVTAPNHLTSPAGELAIRLSTNGVLVSCAGSAGEFAVDAPSDGMRVAAILGFLDGSSESSDE